VPSSAVGFCAVALNVGASFTGVIVIAVVVSALESVPSLTVNVKLSVVVSLPS